MASKAANHLKQVYDASQKTPLGPPIRVATATAIFAGGVGLGLAAGYQLAQAQQSPESPIKGQPINQKIKTTMDKLAELPATIDQATKDSSDIAARILCCKSKLEAYALVFQGIQTQTPSTQQLLAEFPQQLTKLAATCETYRNGITQSDSFIQSVFAVLEGSFRIQQILLRDYVKVLADYDKLRDILNKCSRDIDITHEKIQNIQMEILADPNKTDIPRDQVLEILDKTDGLVDELHLLGDINDTTDAKAC